MAKPFDRAEHLRSIASAGGKARAAKSPASPMKGLTHSAATRKRMSEAHTGRLKPDAKPESIKARGRRIARELHPLPDLCELCDSTATDRHHKDQNTDNNEQSNIQFLCHSCHIRIDNPKHRKK